MCTTQPMHDYDHEATEMQLYHYADFHLSPQPCSARMLRRWQNGDICEQGGRIIGASNATEHARTIEQGTLGRNYRYEGPPCYLAHFFETSRPDVAAGIESLEQNLDSCFAYTFKI